MFIFIISFIIFTISLYSLYNSLMKGSNIGIFLSTYAVLASGSLGIISFMCLCSEGSEQEQQMQSSVEQEYQYCAYLLDNYNNSNVPITEVIKTIDKYNNKILQNQKYLESSLWEVFTYEFYEEMPLIDYSELFNGGEIKCYH